MAKQADKKADSERRALDIADRLAQLKPDKLSERQWTIQAGVSSSFFSNLRGTPTKGPSEPSVGLLRDVLSCVNVTLPEFFLVEGRGRIVRPPTKQALEQILSEQLDELPKPKDKRSAYLADAVLRALALPDNRPSNFGNENDQAAGGLEAVAPSQRSTSQA